MFHYLCQCFPLALPPVVPHLPRSSCSRQESFRIVLSPPRLHVQGMCFFPPTWFPLALADYDAWDRILLSQGLGAGLRWRSCSAPVFVSDLGQSDRWITNLRSFGDFCYVPPTNFVSKADMTCFARIDFPPFHLCSLPPPSLQFIIPFVPRLG